MPFIFVNQMALASESKPIELRWDQLRRLNIKTGEAYSELQNANGKLVKLFGYPIPFEDGKETAAEFLLVGAPLQCIHVPAPPEN